MFHRGCSVDVTSTLRSGLIAGGREGKEGHTVLFTAVNLFGDNPDDKTQQRPIEAVKHTITANGSLIRTLSTVSTWPEHKKGDCSFGRQGDTQRGDTKLYDRLSTSRPAPKMVLNRCRRKPKVPQTDNPNPRSFRKPLRGIELLVAEEEHEFKVDLRGIPQDAVF